MYLKRNLIIWILLGTMLTGFSQSPLLNTPMRIQTGKTTVKAVLYAMERAGGFTFSYGKEVPVDKLVTLGKEERTVREHLDNIFQGDSLAYMERGSKILILPEAKKSKIKMPHQTVRGQILDKDSRSPIAGVNILLNSEGPQKGTSSNEEGFFRFSDVEVGRHDLQVSYVGYRPKAITTVVSSGKESVLEITMEESAYAIQELKITSLRERSQALNSLAVVSGRSFSAYEVENYPGSLSDISRAAVSFPGVVSPNDGQNHMIIRGNSPKGLQWRLEGTEIPNLNHFSEIGASGGGVNVLSNNMLAPSDFLTGAFPAEYGNALSGVFDLRLRTGNNEKHERTLQLGLIGAEAMVEGPIHKASNTTYIAQYRYSTLKVLQELGIDLESVPEFQDLSFKIYHPTKKAGVFSIFGIGGLSHEVSPSGYIMDSDMFTTGLSHNYTINPRTYVRTIVAFSARSFNWFDEANIGTEEIPIDRTRDTDILDYTARASLSVNRKLGSKHRLRAGLNYEMAWNQSYMGWYSDTLFNWYSDPAHEGYQNVTYGHTYIDGKEQAATLQTYLNWNWNIADGLELNTGAHFIQFYLNNNYSFEPRVGLRWNPAPAHSLSAGFGIHSRKESMTLYTGERTLDDGSVIQPNLDLELSKARHYILGYIFRVNPQLILRSEIYYQDLYDVPAYPFPPYFTTMNFDYGYEGSPLLNYGEGYNTGIELMLEKQMHEGIYFLWNGTIYDSKYKDQPGNWLNTKYNGSYASNGLVAKEFKVGRGQQHTLAISSRYIWTGGLRYLPIDEEASTANGYTVRVWDNGFTEKWDDYFRIDLMFKFRRNRPKYTAEWSLDFLNILNRQNALSNYWDPNSRSIQYEYQNPFLVFINYRIQF